MAEIRKFETGATRDGEEGKLDYEGFLSPLVVHRFGEYMHTHRVQSDGSLRASDNWQKGIPLHAYMKSLWRHFHDLWSWHRGFKGKEGLEESLCAILFNAQGYLHEVLKAGRAHTALSIPSTRPSLPAGPPVPAYHPEPAADATGEPSTPIQRLIDRTHTCKCGDTKTIAYNTKGHPLCRECGLEVMVSEGAGL